MAHPPTYFPFFRLPITCICEIVRAAKLVDILKISLLSESAAEFIREARVRIEPIDVQVGFNEIIIHVRRDDNPANDVRWDIPRGRHADQVFIPARIVIHGHSFDCLHYFRWDRLLLTVHPVRSRVNACRYAISHLFYVFNATVDTLVFYAPQFNDHAIWQNLRSCHTARIHGSLSRVPVTEFLTNCTIRNTLVFNGSCPPLADLFHHIQNINDVILYRASWFTIEHLRMVNNRELRVEQTRVTNVDVFDYINEWRRGTNRRFDYIYLSPSMHPYARDAIWPGPWEPVDPPGVMFRPQLQYVCMIPRESDGARIELKVRYDHVWMRFLY